MPRRSGAEPVSRGLQPIDGDGTELPRRRLALLVGINSECGGLNALSRAASDAQCLAKLLENDFGFETCLLLNEEATQAAIEAAIAAALAADNEPTQWLFFFAGHGVVRGNYRGYLVPSDAHDTCLERLVSVDQLIRDADGACPSEILLVLDTCYSGNALLAPEQTSDRLTPCRTGRRRIRQVLAASSPNQSAFELDTSPTSVFTTRLLAALAGFEPVHESDGAVRFDRLRSFIDDELRMRVSLGLIPPQQVVGGNLIGHSEPSGFVFLPRVARIPSETLEDLRSEKAEARTRACRDLVLCCDGDIRRRPLALALLLRHLRLSGVTPAVWGLPALAIEPGPEERQAAIEALSALARPTGICSEDANLERTIAEALTSLATSDPSPTVRRTARRSLKVLTPLHAKTSAIELGAKLEDRIRSTRHRAWVALASFSAGRKALPFGKRWLTPGLLLAAELTHQVRLLWANPTTRRAVLTGLAGITSFYATMASTYYIDLSEPTFFIRSGVKSFDWLPGVGSPLIATGFDASDLAAAPPSSSRITGLWLGSRGIHAWGVQLAERLQFKPAALALWRLGDSAGAKRQLEGAIARGDREAPLLAGYFALQSNEPGTWIELLCPLLEGQEILREPARLALRGLSEVHPSAVAKALGGRLDRLADPPSVLPAKATLSAGQLLDQLEHGTLAQRLEASRTLDAFDLSSLPQGRLATALSPLLDEELELEARSEVLRQLARLTAPAAAEAAQVALSKATRDRSPILRAQAVGQLAARAVAGQTIPRTLEPLLAATLEDSDVTVQDNAAMALVLLGDQIPKHLPAAAARVLHQVVNDSPRSEGTASSLSAQLRDISAPACRALMSQWAVLLPELGPKDNFPVTLFLRALKTAAPQCARALAELGTQLVIEHEKGNGGVLSGEEIFWQVSELPHLDLPAIRSELMANLSSPSSAKRAAAATAAGYFLSTDQASIPSALELLSPLISDENDSVRSRATGALWTLGARVGAPDARMTSLISLRLDDPSPKVRMMALRALRDLPLAQASSPEVVPALIRVLSDPSPQVRQQAGWGLGRWGHAVTASTTLALRAVDERLFVEPEAEVRLALAGALGWLGGNDSELRRRFLAVARQGLASSEPRQRLALEGLEVTARFHPSSSREVLRLIADCLPELGPEAAQSAVLAMAHIGRSHAEGGAQVLSLAEPWLLDLDWSLRDLGLLNIPEPICRFHPELAPQGARLLRRVMGREARDRRTSHRSSTPDLFVQVATLRALAEPNSFWPLLTSPGSGEREIGLRVLAALGDRRPDLLPTLELRLADLASQPLPHVRLTAERGLEMLRLLEQTRRALGDPDRRGRFQQTVQNLPEVGIRPAIQIALDRLEPGVRHE